jgi:co-chaperonin GroES (HSP10)
MSLIIPKHVAAQLRQQSQNAAIKAQKVGGFERAANKHALNSDDFIDPADIAAQVQSFAEYDGAVPAPVGWRVAVLVLTIPETTAGGLIMVDDNREARSLASPQGIVVAVGSQAYKDPARFPDGEPWVKVGDRVMFQKYAGRMFQIRTGQHIAILNDTDFAGVVDSGWLSTQETDA